MRTEALAPMDGGCASRVCLRNAITACSGLQAGNTAAAASQVQKRQRQPCWLPLEIRMHSAVNQCAPKRQFNSSM
ncbi:hypothetical protein PK69_04300 [Xanthomonas phaseoli pv. phaseoli]|uniref:Secreted protein n=1 Tax=Xanthomonas campestris pv. phaseoli TaxID=317013 RepID=A0AB34QFK2_XANCH|nr:hypothetical protein AC609_21325 [Xanthomonas phaseoli pv. phaseoli]AZU32256.1 hypothetical protein AC801_20955 [Xanthomonas sp. ISO98C4]AZU27932.1 hypothetical protein AC611_21350 [Xanthomonas phaseoli pv. phaseoli]AZU36696.1 hypothetical protein AC610_21315 [Xanthomonas phaseoli pv. phaseoli]KGT52598.1 hypothetical protein NZ02_03755 [Xanthomonas phaseoli pv. phaseoli]